MEKAGGSNGCRPRNVVANELLTQMGRLPMDSEEDRFARMPLEDQHERAVCITLQPIPAESYQPVQAAAARTLILTLLRDPSCTPQHMEMYVAAVVLRIMDDKCTPTSESSRSHGVQHVHLHVSRLKTAFVPVRSVELFQLFGVFRRLVSMKWICDALEGVGLGLASRVTGAYGGSWCRRRGTMGGW